LEKKRVFDYTIAVDGCRQILWGVFKKVVIADNLATYVDPLWSNVEQTSGSTLLLGIVLYYIQLYADFSGYTDIAIGMSKTLGLKITNNFKTPLFSLNIADYWKRWHISLTSWLTDYIFMPLNVKYRDAGKWGVVLAIMVTFTVSGIWHGANWTYILWGVYHGLLYIPLIVLGAFYKKAKIKTNRLGLPVLKDVGRMLLTTILVIIGLILFRAPDVHTAWSYVCGICSHSLLSVPNLISYYFYIPMIISIALMILVEWFERNNEGYPSFSLFISNRFMRWSFYFLLLCMIMVWGAFNNQQYIYFQF
jgi:D-alanyl-lipoteichoic acid acyltransferase DltB (MBOAT superfamily)